MQRPFEDFCFDVLGVPPSSVLAGGVIIAAGLLLAAMAYGPLGAFFALLVVAVFVAVAYVKEAA